MGTSMRGGEANMIFSIFIIIGSFAIGIWMIVEYVKYISKDDPPFTIVEKKEKLDEEAREKIQNMLDEMKKD